LLISGTGFGICCGNLFIETGFLFGKNVNSVAAAGCVS
jgi:hypothetical protein